MLVDVAKGRPLPATEGVIGERHGDRHIDADHADLHAGGEFARRIAVAREDGHTVSILMFRRQRHRFLEIVRANDLQHGAEDFVLIGRHVRLDAVEQRTAEIIAVLVTLHLEAAAIDDKLRAFLHALVDIIHHLLAMRGGDERAVRSFGIVGRADLERLDTRLEPVHQRIGDLACDGNRNRRTVARADQFIRHLIEIGVGHDDGVVLGSTHGLHALPAGRALRIDIFGDSRGTDETHGLDVRVFENGIDGVLVAIDDLQHARRAARFHEKFGQAQRYARILFARLVDEAIAASDGDAEHPHRDHGREVERRDAGDNAKRLAHGIDVDAGAGAFGIFALLQMRDAAGEFDHLDAAQHIAARIRQHLAMFGGEHGRQLIHIGFDQRFEIEHHPRAALGIDRGPFRKCLQRMFDGLAHLGAGGERHLGLHLADGGVIDVAEAAGGALHLLAVEEMVVLFHGRPPDAGFRGNGLARRAARFTSKLAAPARQIKVP